MSKRLTQFMCDGERNSRLKKSVEATANRTEGRGTKIGGSAPEPTVSPARLFWRGLLGSIYRCFKYSLVLLPFVSSGEIGSISMFVLVLTLTRKMVLQWGQRIAVMPSLVI
jgi:hypothetical protein